MTVEGLKRILANIEGTEIEYKKSQTGLARSVYESICALTSSSSLATRPYISELSVALAACSVLEPQRWSCGVGC